DLATTGFSDFTGSVRGDSSPTNFPAVLSQRLGYTVNPDEPYWFNGCATNDPVTGCVFPGANGPFIPQSAWSPVPLATLNCIPTPTGESLGKPNFSTTAEESHLRDDKFGVRVDLNTAHLGNWSGYYHFDDANFLSPYPA